MNMACKLGVDSADCMEGSRTLLGGFLVLCSEIECVFMPSVCVYTFVVLCTDMSEYVPDV